MNTHLSRSCTSLRALLARLGLDDREIEVYLILLSMKVAKASAISRAAKQSRSHTYLILRALEEKGLVAEIERGKILHFVAEPPERLLSYLKDREQEYHDLQPLVEGAMPLLQSLTSAYVGSPRVTMLKGIDGVKQTYRDLLRHEFMGIYNPQASYDVFGGNVVTMLFGKGVKLRGKDLLVNNNDAHKYLLEVPQNK